MKLDEFETFEPMRVSATINCSILADRIRISTYAMKFLGYPQFIAVSINKDKRKFAIRAASEHENNTVNLTISTRQSTRNIIRCNLLLYELCKIAKRDSSVVGFTCKGETVTTNQNMPDYVIFDLSDTTPLKKNKKV